MATLHEIFRMARTLTREEQIHLADSLREALTTDARRQLRVGMKAKFTNREGHEVVGTITRINPKSVKLSANFDRFGRPTAHPVMWSVSPQLLSPVVATTVVKEL